MINSLFGFSLVVHLLVIGWYQVMHWLYPLHEYRVIRKNGLPLQILSGAIIVAVGLIIGSVSINILRASIDSTYFSIHLLAYADESLKETVPAAVMTADKLVSLAEQHEFIATFAVVVVASFLLLMLVSRNPFLSEIFFRGRYWRSGSIKVVATLNDPPTKTSST